MPYTVEETNDLISQYKNEKDKEKRDEIYTKISNDNEKLIIEIAKSFINKGLDFEDLMQEGRLAMVKAIENFDVTKKVKFQTFAFKVIRQSIKRALINQGKTIRVPERIVQKLNSILEAEEALSKKLNRKPTEDEVSSYLDISVKELRKLKACAFQVISFDGHYDDKKDITLSEIIKTAENNPEESEDESFDAESLYESLNQLKPKEKEIINMVYGLNGVETHSIEEISQIYGVSKERIRQILNYALNKMKGILDDEK